MAKSQDRPSYTLEDLQNNGTKTPLRYNTNNEPDMPLTKPNEALVCVTEKRMGGTDITFVVDEVHFAGLHEQGKHAQAQTFYRVKDAKAAQSKTETPSAILNNVKLPEQRGWEIGSSGVVR